jgi:uncharacterized protein
VCAELVQVAPVVKEGVACGLPVDLAAPAPRVLLRLGAGHPCAAAVLRAGVLSLDSLVAHGVYDTCCLHMSEKSLGKTISGRPITDGLIDELVARAEAGYPVEEAAGGGTSPDLAEIREDVLRIATAHGAGNVRVFGSVKRGEQGSTSDIGLLVDMAEGRTLFDLIALSNDLEESLGAEVDVVTEAGLSPYIRDRVLDEAVAL